MSEDNSIKVISFRAIPLEIDGRWSVRMEADADVAADGEYIVEGEIHNEASSMSVKLSKGRQRISLDVTPGSVELWYPKGYGYPHIYPCSMKIGAWIGNAIIGFRTASWDDGWLLVNGRRIYLKSAYWKNTDDIERTVRSAADANMNALYADDPPEELYRAADRLGIIVLSSRPDPLHPSAVDSVMMLSHPDISPSIQPFHLFRDGNDEKACIEKLNEPGSGRKALFGIEKTFRRPSSFDKLVYLTELKSAFDAINAVTAERIATGSSKGASIGTLRDSSALSESSLASDGSWKILHYAARLLYAPLCPLMEIDGTKLRIYAVNSGEKEENIELSIKIRDFHGVKKDAREYAATLMPMEAKLFDEIELGRVMRNEYFCYAKLATKNSLRERNILLDSPAHLKLQPPHIKAECKKTGPRSISIKLTAEKPAFYVVIDSGSMRGTFSDNMISVRPSAEKNIVFMTEEEADLDRFRENMRIMDLYTAMC